MSAKVQRCTRCGKRHRNQPDWNVTYIAGLEAGLLCPDCQTAEEHVEAEVNLATEDYSGWQAVKPDTDEGFTRRLIEGLLRSYNSPERLRLKADQLAAARNDRQASEMVRLMRTLADDGDIWE
ncbi:hypothetical protein MSS4_04646 [Mycobacterium marinum]|uniref:hypothetical protein n=1 Tax=Mycobacterium marinum TaxID=1781 RepID=UPI000EDFA065|nr:hypothetical protein [Mycobacterium marinum]RFZ42681.1 hypothetical protein MSS4_04646 [Mycobacterium marinum]